MNNTYHFTDVILHSVLKQSPRFSETYSDLLHCAHLLRWYQSGNVIQTQKFYFLSMHSLNVGHVFQVKWMDMVELEYCNSLTSCIDFKYKRHGMTLLHGHAFRISGSLWGELTVTSEFPVKKAQRPINVMSTLTNGLSNTHDTGELIQFGFHLTSLWWDIHRAWPMVCRRQEIHTTTKFGKINPSSVLWQKLTCIEIKRVAVFRNVNYSFSVWLHKAINGSLVSADLRCPLLMIPQPSKRDI